MVVAFWDWEHLQIVLSLEYGKYTGPLAVDPVKVSFVDKDHVLWAQKRSLTLFPNLKADSAASTNYVSSFFPTLPFEKSLHNLADWFGPINNLEKSLSFSSTWKLW